LLVIDGPPGYLQRDMRHPALPLLSLYFNANTVVMLDDANRKDEQNILTRWLEEFPRWDVRIEPTTRGMAILSRKAS
jgi:hypothetical protein